MKKTFITNLVLLLVLNLLVKPFYILGVEAEIQNRVGPEDFGFFFALINFSFLLNIIPDLGTTNWNTRHIAQNSHLLGKHFPPIFTLRLVLSCLYLLVIGVAALFINYNGEQLAMLGILALSQVFSNMILFLRSNLSGLHLFRHDSFISVLDRILLIGLLSWLLWGRGPDATPFKMIWLAWGQCFTYGLTCLFALWMVVKRSASFKIKLDIPFSIHVIKESAPFAFLLLVSMVAYRVDGVMVERLKSSEEAGIYAMGFRFFEAVNMIAYLFAVLLLPMYSRMLKQKIDVSPVLILGFQVLFCGTLMASYCGLFFPDYLFSIVYDLHIPRAETAFTWLMWSALFFSLQYIFGTLITASGELKPLIYIALSAVTLNIALNFWLIPLDGAIGASQASVITQLFVLLSQIILVIRKFKIHGIGRLLMKTIVFAACCGSIGLYLSTDAIIPWSKAYSLGYFLIACLFLALLTGMLNISRFVKLIRNQE
ncbi:MAG: polysaccharide biosynthesis C-terminal domain-containing protein [Flavobacteriales bacterium]